MEILQSDTKEEQPSKRRRWDTQVWGSIEFKKKKRERKNWNRETHFCMFSVGEATGATEAAGSSFQPQTKKEWKMQKTEKYAHMGKKGLSSWMTGVIIIIMGCVVPRMYQRRLSLDKERSRCLDLSFFASLFSSRRLLSLLRYL